jgi:hypothetical protein
MAAVVDVLSQSKYDESRVPVLKKAWLDGLDAFHENYVVSGYPVGYAVGDILKNLTSVASFTDNPLENPEPVLIQGITVMSIKIEGKLYLWKPRFLLLLSKIKVEMKKDETFFNKFFKELLKQFQYQNGEIRF